MVRTIGKNGRLTLYPAMLYPITSYIKFLSSATNEHGVHSPFIYELVTRCFYDRSIYPEYALLNDHRNSLLKDDDDIEVLDLGAGSKVFRSNTRKVSAIVKNAGIRRKRQQLLFRLVRYFKPGSVLELGTSLGLSTMALALGNEAASIFTLEGCPETSGKAQRYFDVYQMKNIQLHNMEFDTYLSEIKSSYDLIYIDGNHNGEMTIAYFHELLKHVHNDSLVIFDDIYWSMEMTAAWREIIAHERVTVSIDTFQWGLVFFRKEQKKEHFRIRV